MAISGRLDDVSVSEVLQFIHFGSRSGTLFLKNRDAEAEVEFYQGRITAARSSKSMRLGELLVRRGMISRRTLLNAVDLLQREDRGRVLGEVLLSIGAIQRAKLIDAVTEHVQKAILEVVSWTSGTFNFAIDQHRPLEGLEALPGEIFPNIDLNTQMVLLEAARILDEKNAGRDGPSGSLSEGRGASAVQPSTEGPELEAPLDESSQEVPEDAVAGKNLAADEIVETIAIISPDDIFFERASGALRESDFEVERADLGELLLGMGEELAATVLLDMRWQAKTEDLSALHSLYASSALIAVYENEVSSTEAIRAGAIACVEADVLAVVACVQNVASHHRMAIPAIEGGRVDGVSLERLLRLSREIRQGILSTNVALSLMRILSESVERAVLFFVAPESLIVLGAFGNSTVDPDTAVAELTRGVRISLDSESSLVDAIIDRRPRLISAHADGLSFDWIRGMGEPASGEAVLLPIIGSKRVILLVWADNGHLDKPIDDIEILDLLANQVGVALENELLRKRLSKSG